MQEGYNLYNLEPQFKSFLTAGNVSQITLKNYLSDFRHFAGWLEHYVGTDVVSSTARNPDFSVAEFTSSKVERLLRNDMTSEVVFKYRSYLVVNNLPHKTINRRLSALRKFCSFCISQGWMTENPAKKISNIKDSSYATSFAKASKVKKTTEDKQIPPNKALISPKLFSKILSLFRSWRVGFEAGQENRSKKLEKNQASINQLPNSFLNLPSNFGLQHYIGLIIILIFVSVMGAGIYNQFFLKSEKAFAYPTGLTRAGRLLSFQGRLTDSLANPISTATNVTFKLYSVSSGGSALYTAGACSLTPDQDGIFNVLIGGSGYSPTPPQTVCGTEVDSSIFSENADVYLGITVASDSEMTPRQQIANVGYAINSETLQGLPPGSDASNIPYINVDGNLLIAASSPGIRSTSASTDFTLSSAKATVIQSAGTGDIILQATESGTLKFRTGGSTDTENRLTIDGSGNTTVTNQGDLRLAEPSGAGTNYVGLQAPDTLAGDTVYKLPNAFPGAASGYYLTSNTTGDMSWSNSISASSLKWNALTVPDGNLSLAHAGYTTAFTFDSITTEDAFALSSTGLTTGTLFDLSSTSTAGGASGVSKLLDISRSGTNANASHTAYGLYSAVTNTGTTSTNVGGYFSASGATNNYGLIVENGNMGIGTTAPTYKLQVVGEINTNDDLQLTGAAGTGVKYYNAGITFGVDGTITYNPFDGDHIFSGSSASVGVGTTGPDAKLDSLATSGEQLRLTYTDGTVYSGFIVSSTGDLTIDAAGGGTIEQVVLADGDVLNIGGSGSTDVAYNVIGDSTTGASNVDSDDDLYIEGNLEVDGTIYGIFSGTIPWNEIDNPAADLTLTMATYNSTFNWDPGADTAATHFSLTAQGEDTTGTGDQDQVLLSLSQATNGASDVDEGLDALLTLANNDGNDMVQNAIRFDTGAAGIDFTYGINFDAADIGTAELKLENAEQIHNQTDGTITLEDGSGTDYATFSSTTLTALGDLVIQGTTGLTFNTGAGGDITFANGEKIDNDTNGTIAVTGDFDASGTLKAGTADAFSVDTSGNIDTTGTVTGEVFYDKTSTSYYLDPANTGSSLLIAGSIGINDLSPDAKLDIDSTLTTGGDFLITNTGIGTSGTIAGVTANSVTTGDILTLSATALTTGSQLVITGPSGGTAGVTDAGLKIASDVGNSGGTNTGLIYSEATIDTTGVGQSGNNLYIRTINSNSTNANSSTGIFNYMTDAIALANTDFGIYNKVSNTGALDTAATKNVYGIYNTITGTGGAPTTAGTTHVYGEYITTNASHAGDFGTVNQYGLYIANGTSSTNGTSTKYGLYVESPTGADANYAAIFAGGNVGIGTTAPLSKLSVGGVGDSNAAIYGAGTAHGVRADGSIYGVYGTGGTGIYGVGSSFGVEGYSSTGNGVIGSTVSGYGVQGYSSAGGTAGLFETTSGYALLAIGGNVGIGDTTPLATFTVGDGDLFQVAGATGNITTAGDLAVNGDNITADGTLGILGATGLTLQTTTGTVTLDSIDASQIINVGASNVARTLNLGTGTGIDTINIGTGATGVDVITIGNAGTLSLNSNDWDISTTGAMTGITGITNNGVYTQTGTSANTFTGTATFSNATYSALFTGGNVGIGDATPSYLLDVAGTLNSTGSTTLGTGASSVNVIGSTTTPGTLTLHGATTLDNTFTVSGNNLTSLGGNLTLSGTTITASSLATLTTSSAVAWGGATELTFTADNATIYGSNAASGNLILDGTSNATKTSSYVIIQPNGGNVGIGTSAPTATLEILADVDTPSGNAIEVQAVESANLNDQDADDITFTNATTCWTYGAGWARSGGTALHTVLNTADLSCNLTDGYIDNNQIYRMTFDMGGRTAGTVTPKVGTAAHDAISANGSYDLTFDATANNTDIIFTPDINFNGYIDNVYIYRRAVNTVISDTGRVGIGRLVPAYFLDVLAPENGVIARFLSDNTTGCTLATGGTISCTSDVRLKQDIEDTSFGLDTIMNLRPVDFNWKSGASIYKNLGFIAQEVETLIPNLVSIDQDNGYKQLNTTGLIPVLTKAIQEQQIQISSLSGQLADLNITSMGDLQIKNDSQTPYVYDGNQAENFQSIFNNQIYNVKLNTGEIVTRIGAFSELMVGKIKSGLIETENILVDNLLVAKNILVQEKIVSPVVETTDLIATGTAKLNIVQTNEIKPQNSDLTIDLNDDVGVDPGVDPNAGKLAKLIIKGLEGKSAVVIDAVGNASFSGQIIADSLKIDNDATVSGNLASDTLTTNEASISGKLIAGEIESGTIDSLSSNINDVQKLIADIQNQSMPDPTNYQNISSSVIPLKRGIQSQEMDSLLRGNDAFENLTVTGNSNLYNVSVSNSLLVGTTLIDQNSIISLASELKLSALSTINLLDGAVIIAKDGTITTKGELIAEGGIRTNEIKPLTDDGQVTINNLAINNLTINNISTNSAVIAAPDNFTQNGIFAPAIETATSSAGLGILPENSSEIIIYNNNIKESSLIYLTPTSSTVSISQLSVGEKIIGTKSYFKVISNTPSSVPIKFNWLIIN